MSSLLRSKQALYPTNYERRTKECRFCGAAFCDLTKRNLMNTCTEECTYALMAQTRHERGNYVRTDEQNRKTSKSVLKTYASRDVFGPELRKKFSETMKKTWSKTKGNVLGGKVVHHLQRHGRKIPKSWGKSGRRSDLNNQFFRSRWEANVARMLNYQSRVWFYEPTIYRLETISYTPDFYIPDEELFIEVKGWMNERSEKQIKEFLKTYPTARLQIIGTSEYKELVSRFSRLVKGWE